MKLKENQKKMPRRGIEPDKQKLGVHGAEHGSAKIRWPFHFKWCYINVILYSNNQFWWYILHCRDQKKAFQWYITS